MFNIRNRNIYHIRGDTGRFRVELKYEDGEEVAGYEAYFSVKKKLKDEDYLFQVKVEDGVVEITPEMTKNLPFGDFVYDIEVHTEDGEVQTIGPAEYHLMADVTKDFK